MGSTTEWVFKNPRDLTVVRQSHVGFVSLSLGFIGRCLLFFCFHFLFFFCSLLRRARAKGLRQVESTKKDEYESSHRALSCYSVRLKLFLASRALHPLSLSLLPFSVPDFFTAVGLVAAACLPRSCSLSKKIMTVFFEPLCNACENRDDAEILSVCMRVCVWVFSCALDPSVLFSET